MKEDMREERFRAECEELARQWFKSSWYHWHASMNPYTYEAYTDAGRHLAEQACGEELLRLLGLDETEIREVYDEEDPF